MTNLASKPGARSAEHWKCCPQSLLTSFFISCCKPAFYLPPLLSMCEIHLVTFLRLEFVHWFLFFDRHITEVRDFMNSISTSSWLSTWNAVCPLSLICFVWFLGIFVIVIRFSFDRLSLHRLFQQSIQEIDLSGEAAVDWEWMAYVGGCCHLRALCATDCKALTNNALWQLTGKR